MKIDSHQHFWKFDASRDKWITHDMEVIRRDFLPDDLIPLLKQNGFDGCVAVQADQSEAETHFLVKLSSSSHSIAAVVGWVDLCSKNIGERLDYFSQFSILKGFRHILQSESPEFMLKSEFMNGIAALAHYGYTYDILINPAQIAHAAKLVHHFPNQLFVIDHLAKPVIKDNLIADWKANMTLISRYENVYCKISGLVTEAKPKCWHPDDFNPYLDCVFELFGTDRVMFGSDWPVCLLEAEYNTVHAIIERYSSRLSVTEREKLFGLNASKFYKIPQVTI